MFRRSAKQLTKYMKEIKKIKKEMMQSLEKLDDKGIVRGDYLCHQDVPKTCPKGFDDYFCVVGDNENKSWLVLIKEIDNK